jgi:hypothetical protein
LGPDRVAASAQPRLGSGHRPEVAHNADHRDVAWLQRRSIFAATDQTRSEVVNSRLPDPRLNLIYRLEATVGDPHDVGEISAGHRRIVPLTGGSVTVRGDIAEVETAQMIVE